MPAMTVRTSTIETELRYLVFVCVTATLIVGLIIGGLALWSRGWDFAPIAVVLIGGSAGSLYALNKIWPGPRDARARYAPAIVQTLVFAIMAGVFVNTLLAQRKGDLSFHSIHLVVQFFVMSYTGVLAYSEARKAARDTTKLPA